MRKALLITLAILWSGFTFAQSFTWSGNEPIFDNQTDTIYINVSGLPTSIDTTFGLAHICFDITHTADGDLWIYIISPDGSSRTLLSNFGGTGNNFLGTCMGDDGTHIDNTKPPFTGIFEPDANMSTLNNGQNPNGIWKFVVADNAVGDTGSIHNVSIEFLPDPPRATLPTTFITPTGTFVWAGVQCKGGAQSCDLLPDMVSSYRDIFLNHTETPGFLDISNTTPNIGNGPMEIFSIDSCFCGTTNVPCTSSCPSGLKRIVMQRIYQKRPGTDTLGYYDRIAGTMTYHPTHSHLHVDDWVSYTLRTPTSNPDARTWPIIATGTKQSYCLVNLGTCSGTPGMCKDANGDTVRTVQNNGLGFITGCTARQGIYAGSYDVYSQSLNEPIPLTNVCNGNYYVVSITDPNNNFLESDETNNWVAVPVTLTQQNVAPVITANKGTTICAGDSVILTSSFANNYLWSTGATTQSITVKNSGTYTVSYNCGTSQATSAPMTVNVTQVNATPTATPTSPACNGDQVQLNAGAVPASNQNSTMTFSTSTHVFIPDNNTTGVTSPITVSGVSPSALQTNSVISVSLTLTHTYDGDLEVSLISPSGTSIMLSNRRGGSGDNFTNTVFTMSATTLISAGAAPFTGNYKPDGNFASLTGNMNGTWLLKVRDLASVDTGRVRNWSISLNNLAQETFTYAWTGPNGFSSTSATPTVQPLTSSMYSVLITSNATGCSRSLTMNVAVPDTLQANSLFPLSAMAGEVVNIFGRGFNTAAQVKIGGVNAGFMVLSDGQIQAMVPALPTGPTTVCVVNATGCTSCGTLSLSVQSSITYTVKMYIEGFYRGSGQLQATVDPVRSPSTCDTVLVRLHSTTSPYSIEYSLKAILGTNGNCVLNLSGSYAGNSYYVSILHRNAIETWSAAPLTISNGSGYDFTVAAGKAFGSNQKVMPDGSCAFFSGDVSNAGNLLAQDGIIDLYDLTRLGQSSSQFINGYHQTDLTGDLVTESADYSLLENNLPVNVQVKKP